jgi:predicted ATP-binding protein involved in virulence
MELVYLWVEEYKNIEKQGFNFSPRFKCEYDEATNELIIYENKEYVSLFPENINITAIVGENGSGKSSVFELISFFRFERIRKITDKKIVLVFKYKNTLYVTCESIGFTHAFNCSDAINNKTSFSVKQNNITSDELFELTLFTNGLTDFTMQDDSHYLMRTSHFYSFYNGEHIHYKTKDDDKQMHHEFNAKYASLLKIDNNFFDLLGENFLFNKMHIEIDFLRKNEFSSYYYDENDDKEFFEKINLFYNSNFGVLEEVTFGEDDKKIELENDKKNELIYKFLSFYFFKLYVNLVRRFENDFKGELRDKFKKDFIEKYKEYVLIPLNIEETKKAKVVVYVSILSITAQYYKKLDKLFRNIFKDNKGMLDDYIVHQKELRYIKRLQALVHIIDNNFEFENYEKQSFLLVSKFVPINQEKINNFYKKIDNNDFLQDLYSSGLIRLNFYNNDRGYNYRKLSTGEKQLLNFLVNFSYTLSKMNYTDKSVIFMEEVEIAMHPEWQRNIFNIILLIFNKLQKLKIINHANKYHLLYTTHSPFLLSDIPKENVIFLEKGKQVYPFEDEKQTFGANIHTLLSHGFFMKDGLMGEFAKGKIDKAIKYLNQKSLSKEEIDYCENIISIIGEPILKNQLQRMLDSKRLSEIDVIKQEIKRLEDRMTLIWKNSK